MEREKQIQDDLKEETTGLGGRLDPQVKRKESKIPLRLGSQRHRPSRAMQEV